MGFYSPSQLIQDARRHDIEVLPIDVQHSDWHHQLVPTTHTTTHTTNRTTNRTTGPALRLGLRLVKGLRESAGDAIMTARNAAHPHFRNQADLQRRTGLNRQSLEFLARAGALKNRLPFLYPRPPPRTTCWPTTATPALRWVRTR